MIDFGLIAANGGLNLDDEFFNGQYSRTRDSGGIYAAAINPYLGEPADFTEYGSRMDLFSWGK